MQSIGDICNLNQNITQIKAIHTRPILKCDRGFVILCIIRHIHHDTTSTLTAVLKVQLYDVFWRLWLQSLHQNAVGDLHAFCCQSASLQFLLTEFLDDRIDTWKIKIEIRKWKFVDQSSKVVSDKPTEERLFESSVASPYNMSAIKCYTQNTQTPIHTFISETWT